MGLCTDLGVRLSNTLPVLMLRLRDDGSGVKAAAGALRGASAAASFIEADGALCRVESSTYVSAALENVPLA